MEINLYGVASINLDKMRGHEIKRYMKILIVIYLLILLMGSLLPERILTDKSGRIDLGPKN